MKYLSFTILCLSTFFMSCTKYIDLDSRKTSQVIAIEGIITDTNLSYFNRVIVTKSVALGTAVDVMNGSHIIKNASVKIYSASDTFNLQYNSSIMAYTNSNIKGIPGTTYYLEVKYNGKTYTSSSRMPSKPIPINTKSILTVRESLGQQDSGQTYNIDVLFSDSPQTKDYYMLAGIIRQENPDVFSLLRKVREDKFFNGNTFRTNVHFYNDKEINNTSTVQVIVSKINRDAYKYYYVLFKVTGQERQGGPLIANGNPKTNIVGESVTGIFSAQSVSVASKKLK